MDNTFEQRLTALYDTAKKQKDSALAQLQKAKKASKAMEDKAAAEAACTAARSWRPMSRPAAQT